MAACLAAAEAVRDAATIDAFPGPGGSVAIRLRPQSARDAEAVRALGLDLADPQTQAEQQ